jgi:N-acetylmuramoyl-L-alanine amidase
MRKIDKLIIHCTATKEGQDISIETIKKWHVEGNGWTDIGYHYIIDLDGNIHKGRADEVVGAHTKGHNSNSIGICYIGGLDNKMQPKDTRTEDQKAALVDLLKTLKRQFWQARVYGHCDFSIKACPSFDATGEYEYITLYNF